MLLTVTVCVAAASTVAVAASLPSSSSSSSSSASPLTFPLHRREGTGSSPELRRRRRLVTGDTAFSAEHNTWGTIAQEGYFYSYLRVGSPMQKFAVILDTGSSITSIPCKGCSNCGTHMDAAFDVSKSTTAHDTGSVFSQSYLEGSSLRGTFVEDDVCLGDQCAAVEQVRFKFGCATTMTNMFRTQKADGIIGLDMSSRSLLHELAAHHKLNADTFSLCFGRSGGFLSVGGITSVHHVQPLIWSPFASTGAHYQLVLNSMEIVGQGGSVVSVPGGKAIAMIDTGSTFSYVTPPIWNPLSAAWHAWCAVDTKTRCLGTPSSHDATSIACFTASSAKIATFPTVRLKLGGGGTLCIPAEQIMFLEEGHLCVGLLRDPRLVIGANIMLDYDVVFDISARRVGFARSVCGKDATPFCCGGECSSASTKLLPAQGLRGAHAAAGSVAVATATANVEQAVAVAKQAEQLQKSGAMGLVDNVLESIASLLTSTDGGPGRAAGATSGLKPIR